MPNHCNFCDTRRPEGGTNMLVLNGNDWLEYCKPCGVSVKLTNAETNEQKTLKEIADGGRG